MSDELLADLRSDEGWRPSAYLDHLGYVTIGYGFLIDAKKGGELPKSVAEVWLRHAVNERLEQLERRWSAYSKQPEDVQRALGNMVYQMGVDGVLGFRTMLAALAVGDRARAAEAALESRWAKQTPERAQRVVALIRGS
jgi:lysozyme